MRTTTGFIGVLNVEFYCNKVDNYIFKDQFIQNIQLGDPNEAYISIFLPEWAPSML